MAGLSDIPAITCAENIALLSLLHSVSSSGLVQSVPAPPLSNTTSYLPSGQKDYILSFERERSLVGILAFLAQTKDDPNHIPAVCIEQALELGGLNVLLAVNKNKWSDGDDVLHDLKQHFDGLFSVLSTLSDSDRRHDSLTMEEELFARIVSMCSTRILQRLRLSSSKKKPSWKPKMPIKVVLQNVMGHVKQIKTERMPAEELQSTQALFTTRAEEVVRLIDLWSGCQTATRLGDLVKGIYHLHQVVKPSNLFGLIPTFDMQCNEKTGLLNTISKVARYQEAARVLYRTAKKNPLARQMTAVYVKLPEEAFSLASASTYSPALLSTATRIDQQYHQKNLSSRILHPLKISEEKAAGQFSEQVHRTLRKAKIHAEVQLVTHCELQKATLPPRVFCSSKDTCFLCSSLIHLYKRIHTPRSHGRLYPGWRLPALPQIKEIEQRFNKALEDSIKKSLSMLAMRQQKTIYPFPNESTLLTITASETTNCSPAQCELDSVDLQPLLPRISEKTSQFVLSLTEASCALPKSASAARLQLGKSPVEELLSQGSRLLGCLNPGTTSPLYTAGHLGLEIEYAVGLKSIGYSIEWLAGKDAGKVPDGQYPSLDAESIPSEVSLQNQKGLHIVAKGTILSVAWHSQMA